MTPKTGGHWKMRQGHGIRACFTKKPWKNTYRAFRRLGLDVDVIDETQGLSDYQIVAAPVVYLQREGWAEKVRQFVAGGGTFLATYWSGIVDETDLCFLGGTPHGLLDVMGLRSMEIDGLYDGEWNEGVPVPQNRLHLTRTYRCSNLCELVKPSTAEVLMTYGKDFYAGMPALTENQYGAGKAYQICAGFEQGLYDELCGKLAEEAQLTEKFEALYNGEVVNTGEKRLVLHHMTRGQLGDAVEADGVDKRTFYVEQQKKIAEFANKVHAGEITNGAGEKFTTVVQIGIGGSDLGPRAMYLALENWAKKNDTFKMEAKFISNVDPDDAAAVLNSVDVAHSIFVLVSKSGTTLETLTNESFVKDALKNAGLDASKHMIAVTSETSPLAKSDDYLAAFFMDDYIGGRFSSTSAVGGAVLSLAFGPEVFAQFLDGAAAEDKLSLNKNIKENPEMLDALIGVYERNVLGYPSTAVLPYSQALSRFPAHLQQLDMESNGKSVNRFGEPVDYVTGPVIFGEPGTNGQHSFYQLLHQGTDIVPLQFVGFKNSQIGTDVVIQDSTSQQKLCANVAAQIVAICMW